MDGKFNLWILLLQIRILKFRKNYQVFHADVGCVQSKKFIDYTKALRSKASDFKKYHFRICGEIYKLL